MGIDYARQKLREAVDILATGTGSLQQRLAQAYIPHIAVIHPTDDIRKAMSPTFADLKKYFEIRQDSGIGDAEASALALTNEEAQAAAQLIVDLFCDAMRKV